MRIPLFIAPFACTLVASCGNPLCPPNPKPPACTPEAAGLSSANAIEPTSFAPPDGCTLANDATFAPTPGTTKTIATEDDAEALYACGSDEGAKPGSGVDFAHQKIVVVSGEQVPSTETLALAWSVHDEHGLHLGFVSGTCGGAGPATVEGVFVVDAADDVDVTACQADCGGDACDPARP